MQAWPTTAPDPLGGQQPLSAQQPQDPFAADADAVLATQPGPDLAVALPGEGRGFQDLAEQLDQVAVADRGGRPRPGPLLAMAAGVDAGAGRAEHAAHHRHRQLVGHG
jgi:hypothetical protein